MQDFRLRIQLHSPAGSPWQSDTLFGHLAWQAALGRCDLGIEEFLEPFRRGQPPFILSDAFPEGLLPRPVMPESARGGPPPLPRNVADYAAAKKHKKSPWLSAEDFSRLRRGGPFTPESVASPWKKVTTLHASLDRRTLRTGGEGSAGALFETTASVLDPPVLDLYLRAVDEFWAARAEVLLREVAHAGFGRDKSTGSGAFQVLSREPTNNFDPTATTPNAVVLLSTCVPAPNDPVRGAWRLRVKHGKLGEPYGPAGANPFKFPLLQLEAGAVFCLGAHETPRPWYGRLVEGLSPSRPEAVQSCYSLAVPFLLP